MRLTAPGFSIVGVGALPPPEPGNFGSSTASWSETNSYGGEGQERAPSGEYIQFTLHTSLGFAFIPQQNKMLELTTR